MLAERGQEMTVSLRLEMEASIEHEPSSVVVTREKERACDLGMVTRHNMREEGKYF